MKCLATQGNLAEGSLRFLHHNDNDLVGDLAAFNTNRHLPWIIRRGDTVVNGSPSPGCQDLLICTSCRQQIENRLDNAVIPRFL